MNSDVGERLLRLDRDVWRARAESLRDELGLAIRTRDEWEANAEGRLSEIDAALRELVEPVCACKKETCAEYRYGMWILNILDGGTA